MLSRCSEGDDEPRTRGGAQEAAAENADEIRAAQHRASAVHTDLKIGAGTVESLKGKTPKERRPQMSAFVGNLTKDALSARMGEEISTDEFAAARQHARTYGKGAPLPDFKVKHTRHRIPTQMLKDLNQWLDEEDCLQRTAFGEKILELSTGKSVTLDAVGLTAQLRPIVIDYLTQLNTRLLERTASSKQLGDDERCSCVCPKYKQRCRRTKGHKGHRVCGRVCGSAKFKLFNSNTT
jgi:hypothetical protein